MADFKLGMADFKLGMTDFKLGLADLKLVSYPKDLKSIKSKLGWLTLSYLKNPQKIEHSLQNGILA